LVDTETVTVTAGTTVYTTPKGYTLPTKGTVTGTYQWDAKYSGDSNNKPASDTNNCNEQVSVSPAGPTISTTPSSTSVALGTNPVTIKDTATLSGGYYGTGTITFTLYLGSTKLDTETVNVTSGAVTYTTPTGYTLTSSSAAGTYQWNATYSGDGNNKCATDINNCNEQVKVTYASGSISGSKYLDITGNGFSNDDTPLKGASFSLYFDTNHDGVLDCGDAKVATTTSGSNGVYSFANLSPGTYFVQENQMNGYIQTGPALLSYYTINVTPGSANTGYNFDDVVTGCSCQISQISYTITGPGIYGTKTVTDLRGNTNEGDTVTVKYYVTSAGATESLVSYIAPGPSFDANTAFEQTIFQASTLANASVGWHTLTVLLPNCDYQVDFVCGLPINQFGRAGSNIFYTPQGRLFSADNEGNQCDAASSLSGYVFANSSGNCNQGFGQVGLGGVTITLSGTDIYGNAVLLTTKTNSSGYYIFDNLNASNSAGYKITEMTPSGYSYLNDAAGSLGGSAGVDLLSGIVINTNQNGTNYNFAVKKD
jgi:hypothetical protein